MVVTTGVVTKLDFRFDTVQDEFSGILMYEIRKKGNIRFNHQSGTDSISTKVIEKTLKMMRLLVTWKIKYSGQPKVNIMLVDYDNKLILDEDKLVKLYNKVNGIPADHNSSGCVRLLCDDIMLEVTPKVVWESGLKLDITASTILRDPDIIKPMRIESEG